MILRNAKDEIAPNMATLSDSIIEKLKDINFLHVAVNINMFCYANVLFLIII